MGNSLSLAVGDWNTASIVGSKKYFLSNTYVYHGMYVEARVQLLEIGSLLPLWDWETGIGHQVCVLITFIHWAISLALISIFGLKVTKDAIINLQYYANSFNTW